MNQETLLEIKNLYISVKSDGHSLPIVENVSLSLKAGEILALVGESGCGKSVTAQSVMQLLPKPLMIESGEIRMNSHKQ
jgi:peptide/nickel transport system ATP-binding protein